MRPQVLICSFLDAELIKRISDEVPQVDVNYCPELLPIPQFSADHWGNVRELTSSQLEQWREHLANATIMFDFDWWEPQDWREKSPKLRWIQATQAGVGTRAEALGHHDNKMLITTAAGVHAKPLAEFALAGLLYFVRDLPALEARRQTEVWSGGHSSTLYGRRALMVGAGSIGREVARTLSFMGVSCDGTTRSGRELGQPFENSVNLNDCWLESYDVVVLSCPLTRETRGLFGEQQISAMKKGSILVNLARGPVLDQDALLAALVSGHLGGAVLDVASPEPLPQGDPLWKAPNLVLSPHCAANVDAENTRLVELFIKNIRRFLDGEELINRYDPHAGY